MTSEMNCTVATHRNFPTGYLPPHWLDQSHLERITSLCLPNRQSTCQIRFDQRSCICCDLRCFLFSYIYLFLRLSFCVSACQLSTLEQSLHHIHTASLFRFQLSTMGPRPRFSRTDLVQAVSRGHVRICNPPFLISHEHIPRKTGYDSSMRVIFIDDFESFPAIHI